MITICDSSRAIDGQKLNKKFITNSLIYLF